jgi:hypothetical protein
VRPDPPADPGTSGDPTHDPLGSVPIEPVAVGSEDGRRVGEWRRHQLAALTQHGQRPMATLETEGCDVGADPSDTRNPFNANSDTSAWSRQRPRRQACHPHIDEARATARLPARPVDAIGRSHDRHLKSGEAIP